MVRKAAWSAGAQAGQQPRPAGPGKADGGPLADLGPVEVPRPAPVSHLSYSALESFGRCGYRFYLERVLALQDGADRRPGAQALAPETPEEALEAPGADELPALLRGTIVHELLEGLDFGEPAVPDRGAVADRLEHHGATYADADLEEIAGLVASFAGSDLCRRIAAADAVTRERRFGFLLESDAGRSMVVSGVVDVHAREGDRVLIVDYKSDHLDGRTPAELVERKYAIQRQVYALAALRDGALEVEVVYCFLERSGEPVVATFSQDDAERLHEELNRLAAGILAGDFSVTEEPHRDLCQSCPGRRSLCSWDEDMTMRDLPQLAQAG
jgi:ATP-dependent exoDNAse (exonuclease V) beta subunit